MNRVPRDKLLFVHIPRTGGGSLINVLDDHYDISDIAPFWNPQDFASDPDRDLTAYNLVRGHCGPNELERLSHANFSVITFLRDPVARTASIYRWLRTLKVEEELRAGAVAAEAYGAEKPTFDPRSQRAIEAALSLSFEDFVEAEVALDFVSNGQAINLGASPVGPGTPARPPHALKDQREGAIQGQILPTARRFLERCLTIGLVEKYDQSLILLHYLMGWPLAPKVANFHDTKAHVEMTQLTDRARTTIEERNKADFELYRFAVERFDHQFEEMMKDLGTTDPKGLGEAVNQRFHERIRRDAAVSPSVRLKASMAWPGIGWSERRVAAPGQYYRSFGRKDVVTLFVALDASIDVGRSRVLTLYLQNCVDADPSEHICVEIGGQRLEFGGSGPLTDPNTGLPPSFPYYWSLPYGKIYEHDGRLEISIRLEKCGTSASVSVGAIEVS